MGENARWLAVQSTYFENLFFNENCVEFGKEGVELKKTEPEDIVNDDNVEDILFMADRVSGKNRVPEVQEVLIAGV